MGYLQRLLFELIIRLQDIISHTSNFFVGINGILNQVLERLRPFDVLQDHIGDIRNIDTCLTTNPAGITGLVTGSVNQLCAVPENLPRFKAHLLIFTLRVWHIGQQHRIVFGTGQAVLNFRLQRVVGIRRESPVQLDTEYHIIRSDEADRFRRIAHFTRKIYF
ncbi:hypothetical protein WLF10_04336 [Enterobacter cloacae]